MRKGNRSGSATLGLAFFVVSLAIVPVSLKSWGYGTAFSPTLTAVIDVWRQISGFIGDGYPTPGTGPVELTTPVGTHDCSGGAIAEAIDVESHPGCDGGGARQPAGVAEPPRSESKTEAQTEGSRAAARAPERASGQMRAVTTAAPLAQPAVAFAMSREARKAEKSDVKVARAITLDVPSAEWRRSLSREIARHGADVAELTRSLGLPSDGRLLIKVDPAPAVPAPPSRRCGSTRTTSEQRFEYRFEFRGARELENHVLRLIGTRKKAIAEFVKRSA
jgi:hypothetical protein